MNPHGQHFFNNEDNKVDNHFPPLIFPCHYCDAHFSSLEERNVHRVFSGCNQKGRKIEVDLNLTHTSEEPRTPSVSNSTEESTTVAQMALPPSHKIKPFDVNQSSKVVPPQHVTMDLLSPVRGAGLRSYQMHADGKKGEASSSAHDSVALRLALPNVPRAEIVDTTLALGLPGSKKKPTIKKPKVDLNLKI